MWSKLAVVAASVLLALVPLSSAQAASLLPSEKHLYTVQLRSDKRALNYAKIIFENKHSENDMTTYTFSLPQGVEVQDLTSQQILAKRQGNNPSQPCSAYESLEDWKIRTGRGSQSWSPSYIPPSYEAEKICLQKEDGTGADEYDEDFDYYSNTSSSKYYSYSYYSSRDDQFKYADLDLKESEGKYTITLSNPVKPGKQGAILISYISQDFISGALGYYQYQYKTLVSQQTIESATVAINFDSGLYSRDAKQKRTSETSTTSDSSGLSAGASANANSSRSTDNLQWNIGQGGIYTKTQDNLIPGDVMTVKGVFAEHPLLLFTKEIIIGLIVLALFIGGSIFGFRRYRRKHPKTAASNATKSDADSAASAASTPQTTPAKATAPASTFLPEPSPLVLIGVSLLSLVAGLVVASVGLSISMLVSDNYYTSSISNFLLIAQLVTVLSAYAVVAMVLPLAYVLRYGSKVAFRWVLIHLAVFVAVGILALLLALVIGAADTSIEPPYYPYYD